MLPALFFTAHRLCQKGQFIRRGRGPSRNEIAASCCITITSKGQRNTWAPISLAPAKLTRSLARAKLTRVVGGCRVRGATIRKHLDAAAASRASARLRPPGLPTSAAARWTPKQSLEKSTLIMARVVGNMFRRGALLLLLFYFKTGANELVHLIASLKVALGELLINLVARISVPNEARDCYNQLTVSSEPGIAGLEQREGGAAHARVLRTEQLIHMRFRQRAVFDHDGLPQGEDLIAQRSHLRGRLRTLWCLESYLRTRERATVVGQACRLEDGTLRCSCQSTHSLRGATTRSRRCTSPGLGARGGARGSNTCRRSRSRPPAMAERGTGTVAVVEREPGT